MTVRLSSLIGSLLLLHAFKWWLVSPILSPKIERLTKVPALPIQLEGIRVAATEDDFVFVADGLVARYIAAHVDLIHRWIELVDDITGDVPGTRRALAAHIRHHIAVSVIENNELGKVLKHRLLSDQS